MKFAVLKEEITPHIPVLQAGFAARTHKSEGVHDAPYASVVIMRANKTVVIIALDVVYADRSFAHGIKTAIFDRFGLKQDEIIINYSHTHSVVAVTGEDPVLRPERPYSINLDRFLWGETWSDVDCTEDVKYYNAIKDKIMSMLERGFENLVEGEAYLTKEFSRFGVSRRFPVDGGVLWKPYFNDDAIDTDLFLIKLQDDTGKIHGLLYNYACHPTSMGSDNYLISADFPGAVRDSLEKSNPGMIPVFLQGCGADIKPYISAVDGQFTSCNFEQLKQAGESLASEIREAIKRDGWRKIEPEFTTKSDMVNLYTHIWDTKVWEDMLNDPETPEYRKASVRQVLNYIREKKIKNYLPYYISVLSFNEDICIVALEDEVVSDIGKLIKSVIKDKTVITLGYSNSSVCYIPTKKVLNDGGYESMSFINARLAGPFVPEIEDIIIGKTVQLCL